MRKSLLVFDLDDTLVSSENAYERALQKINFSVHDEDFKRARSEVKQRLGSGHVAARNRWLYFKKLRENQNKFSATQIIQDMEFYETALLEDLKSQWLKLKRDELFRELRKLCELAVLTNENTRTQLLKLSVLDPNGLYFSHIVTSEEVGVEKPHMKIFDELKGRYPQIQSKDITFIGDSISNDIVPARRIGWNAILTREFSQGAIDDEVGDVRVIENLDEVLGYARGEMN